jgi:hypothetical protein
MCGVEEEIAMHDFEGPKMPRPANKWLESLSRRRQQTGAALMLTGFLVVVFAVFRLVTYLRQPAENTWVDFAFDLLVGSGLLGIGLWQNLRTPGDQLSEEEATRLGILAVGGVIGFAVTVLGLSLGLYWWDTFSGGIESWRKEGWRVTWTILALFGGLALMFVSLQMARTGERSSATLRRLLYGYNAVLTGFLLLAILLVFNVMTYLHIEPLNSLFAKPSDWTASSIFTLSTASKNLLASIDQPVKLYVVLSRRDPIYAEVETLIGNCQAENRRLEVEYVSPDLSPRKVGELVRKYQLLEVDGILIVYGSEPKEEHEFINRKDLFTEDPRTSKFSFQGENALITKLTVLTEGKSRSVVYFTQGDGELDFKDLNTTRPDEGLGQLKDNLQKANYDVKELRLDDPLLKRIPEDAEIVVIARPTRALSTAGLEALRAYMNPPAAEAKKGKMVVMLDVVANREGALVETGLEKFLEEFGVKVGNERILTVPTNQFTLEPLRIYAEANGGSRNPVAIAFAQEPPIIFFEARPVSPKSPEANQPSTAYSAETIFQDRFLSMIEKPPLHADPRDYLQKLIKDSRNDKERAKAFEASLSETVSVAVAVTSWAPPSGDDDPRAFMRQGNQQPRMVVFGDATWISNKEITRPGAGGYELFLSTLSWLRERPNIGKTADPKERKFYTLSASPDAVTRLQWLPGVLICVGLLGVGGGIWVVRRR